MAYNILIVDDSALSRSMCKKALEMTGLDVGMILQAENGCVALQKLRDNWVDLVFADLQMPDMNGIELAGAMAKDPDLQRIPVVIVTADRSSARRGTLENLGVRGYINKPWRTEQLKSIADRVLLETTG